MSVQEIFLPDIGDFKGVEIIEILVQPGDSVAENDSLMTLESDKASMEIPAPAAGVVKEWKVKLGDKIATGDLIMLMEVRGAAPTKADKPAEKPAEKAPEVAAVPAPAKAVELAKPPVAASTPAAPAEKPINAQPSGAKFHASPAMRAVAREMGVPLAKVSGTGPKGRITKADIQAYVKQVMKAVESGSLAGAGGVGIPPMPAVDFKQFGEIEFKDLSRIKKLSGAHLSRCWLNVPHVTQFDEVDISEMEDFRQAMKDKAARENIKLTPLVFIMKAVASALKKYPQFNSSLSADNSQLILKKFINIGVAVDTQNGLVVPVFKDVDRKSLFDLSRELMEVSARARDGKLTPADMSGGTFTISSLGGIGGTQFTPIVNAPEVAILGVSRSSMKPIWNGKDFEPKLMLPLALSYDHRVIDGAEGARFIVTLGQYLSDIREMLL